MLGVPAAFLAFDRGGYWIDFVLPVLATSVTGSGQRRAQPAALPRLVRALPLARRDGPGAEPTRRACAASIARCRSCSPTCGASRPCPSRWSRSGSPRTSTSTSTAMTAAIFAHRGMINDFVGDAVMAVFGAPVDDPDHAWHAVQSAQAMDRALEALNRRWDGCRPAAAAHGDRHPHRGGVRGQRRRPGPHQVHGHRRPGERGVPRGGIEQGAGHDDA